MDRRRWPLEESMREMTLEDGRPDPGDPPTTPESTMMDLDGGGGAADICRQRGNNDVVPLQQQHPGRTLAPAVHAAVTPVGAAATGTVGRGHDEAARRGVPSHQQQPNARAGRVLGVEDILLELLPEGSVLVGYTVDGYLFA